VLIRIASFLPRIKCGAKMTFGGVVAVIVSKFLLLIGYNDIVIFYNLSQGFDSSIDHPRCNLFGFQVSGYLAEIRTKPFHSNEMVNIRLTHLAKAFTLHKPSKFNDSVIGSAGSPVDPLAR